MKNETREGAVTAVPGGEAGAVRRPTEKPARTGTWKAVISLIFALCMTAATAVYLRWYLEVLPKYVGDVLESTGNKRFLNEMVCGLAAFLAGGLLMAAGAVLRGRGVRFFGIGVLLAGGLMGLIAFFAGDGAARMANHMTNYILVSTGGSLLLLTGTLLTGVGALTGRRRLKPVGAILLLLTALASVLLVWTDIGDLAENLEVYVTLRMLLTEDSFRQERYNTVFASAFLFFSLSALAFPLQKRERKTT